MCRLRKKTLYICMKMGPQKIVLTELVDVQDVVTTKYPWSRFDANNVITISTSLSIVCRYKKLKILIKGSKYIIEHHMRCSSLDTPILVSMGIFHSTCMVSLGAKDVCKSYVISRIQHFKKPSEVFFWVIFFVGFFFFWVDNYSIPLRPSKNTGIGTDLRIWKTRLNITNVNQNHIGENMVVQNFIIVWSFLKDLNCLKHCCNIVPTKRSLGYQNWYVHLFKVRF